MRFELWEASDEGGTESMLLGDSDEYQKSREMLIDERNMKLTWSFEADDHDQAMQMYYDHWDGVNTPRPMSFPVFASRLFPP
jgi:hypothetical protein